MYLQERLKVMEYELSQKWPFFDSCVDHVNIKDNEYVMRGKRNWNIFFLYENITKKLILVISRDETVPSIPEDSYILSDGRKIHHQSRMFIVPPEFYEGKGRTLFDFYNDDYLEADGHFILRIIGTNARYVEFIR